MCTIIQTHKARRVVIFYGFGIAERLEDGVGLQELPFQLPLWKNTHTEESHQPSSISNGRHSSTMNQLAPYFMGLVGQNPRAESRRADEAKSVLLQSS